MQSGYLSIETHQTHPGLARLLLSTQPPDVEPGTHAITRVRYIARFSDSEAALMHMHEILKRHLIDLDAHLYRVPVERAIAAAESLDLRHRRTYLDPGLSEQSQSLIDARAERIRQNRRARNRFFEMLGYVAIGLLLFNLLVFSVR